MSVDRRWLQIETHFDALIDMSAHARESALSRIGEADAAIREEIESLLSFAAVTDSILDQPAAHALTGTRDTVGDSTVSQGDRIGPYRIVELIGRGGMGEVYRAERADGAYAQQVALKLIRPGAAMQPAKFEAERQILADLGHPGIARLLDGGVTPDGQPFMVMELVEGRQIIEWCRDTGADLAERLRLFCEICTAVAFAHRNLVIHRDLKPSNVLVTAAGTVKLLDFGAAKLLNAPHPDQTRQTPLTPNYASPEQLTGAPITTATDVYGLGLLLFELLTQTRPWSVGDLSIVATMRTILDEDAPPPSAVARRLACPPVAGRLLAGDLDAIVAKALRKEPDRRYQSVDALRDDIGRFSRSEPVSARSGNFGYIAGRALRRHAVLAASALALGVVLFGGAAGMAWQAEKARAEARKEAAVKEFLINVFRTSTVNNPDGAAARDTTALQLLDKGANTIAEHLGEAPEVRGELIDTLADLYDQLEEFARVETLERERLADLQATEGARPSAARAASLAELGRALTMQGRYGEADGVLNDALRMMDRLGDDHSAARVQALTTLGLVDYHVKPAADPTAGTHTSQALALLERYNPDSPDRLTAVQLLARLADRRHDKPEAERGYRAFVALAEMPQFKDQPVALGCALDDLGVFLSDSQRYSEAIHLLRRAVEILDKAEGPEEMDAALAHEHLGQLLAAAGQTAEGFQNLQLALSAVEHTQGGSPPAVTAPVRLALADFEYRRGRGNVARELYEKNLAVFDAAQTSEVTAHATTYTHYARLLLEGGDTVKSAQAVEASMPLLASSQDPNAEARGLSLVLLADLAAARSDRAAAERQYAAVMADWAPTSTELPTPYLQAALGQIDLALGRHEPALAVLRARALLSVVLGMPEQQFRGDEESDARLAMGRAWLAAAQPAAAKQELERSAQIRAGRDDPGSPLLALNLSLLAEASRELGPSDPPVASGREARRSLRRFPAFEARFRNSLPRRELPADRAGFRQSTVL